MNTECTFPPITVIDCLQNRLPKKRTSPFRKGRFRGIYHYFERPESPLVPLFQRGRPISAACKRMNASLNRFFVLSSRLATPSSSGVMPALCQPHHARKRQKCKIAKITKQPINDRTNGLPTRLRDCHASRCRIGMARNDNRQ